MRWCSDTVVVCRVSAAALCALCGGYLSAAHLIVAALLVNNFTSPVTTVTIALLHGGWSTGCQLDLTYTGMAHWHSQAESFLFPPQSWGFFRYLVNKISQFNIFPYSIFFETKFKCNVVNILQYSYSTVGLISGRCTGIESVEGKIMTQPNYRWKGSYPRTFWDYFRMHICRPQNTEIRRYNRVLRYSYTLLLLVALFRRDQLPPCTIMSGDTCYDAAKHARLPPTGVTDSGLLRINNHYFIIIIYSFLCILQFGWSRLSICSVVSTQNEETLIFINIMEYKSFKVLKLWLEFKLATCWKHFLISPFYRSVGAASASIRYPGNYRQMLGLNTLIGRWRQCF